MFEACGLSGKIDPQLASRERNVCESLLCLCRRLNISEVCVGEATGPSRGAVDGNTDVLDVVQVLENTVQLRVRRLVGDVANVQRSCRTNALPAVIFLPLASTNAAAHSDAATVPKRVVGSSNGGVPLTLLGEPYEAISVNDCLACCT